MNMNENEIEENLIHNYAPITYDNIPIDSKTEAATSNRIERT